MKKAIAMLLAAVMVLSLAACGSKEAAPAVTETAAPEAAAAETAKAETEAAEISSEGEEKVLKFAGFAGGYGSQYWDEIFAAFEASHPGVKIESVFNPKIDDIVMPQMVAGEYPDVYYPGSTTNPVISSLINERQLLDLTDVFEGPGFEDQTPLKDQLIAGFLDSTCCDNYQDGHVYCAPLSICTRGMVYNKKLFADHGWKVPETWDEFFALGDEARKEGIALMTYPGIYPDYINWMFWPSVASAIGLEKTIQISQRTEGIITTPEARKTFENMAKIATDGYLLEGTVGMNHTQSQSEFILDKCLFIPNGDWLAEEMAEAPHSEGFEYGMCPPPTVEKGQEQFVVSIPDIICVPAQAKNPELAKEFVRFLYTDSSVKSMAGSGILQCTKTAGEVTKGLLNDSFLSLHEVDSYATPLVWNWKPDEEGSRIVIWDVVNNPIADVMSGNETAEQWVDDIEAAFHAANNGE